MKLAYRESSLRLVMDYHQRGEAASSSKRDAELSTRRMIERGICLPLPE